MLLASGRYLVLSIRLCPYTKYFRLFPYTVLDLLRMRMRIIALRQVVHAEATVKNDIPKRYLSLTNDIPKTRYHVRDLDPD